MIFPVAPTLVGDNDYLLTARLERWANLRPDRKALVFLGDGEQETDSLTFAGLHHAALRLAERLRQAKTGGHPVLILLRPGTDFAVAFFATLYAGAIAVPTSSGPRNRGWERIAAIVADAKPVAVLGNAEVLSELQAVEALGIPAFRTDLASDEWRGAAAPPQLRNAPALLQYTSGSTGQPKGVVITHHNLASNLQMLCSSFCVHDQSIYLTWLPLFHDMGLIGNFLSAIYSGIPCILMPPLSFYQKPRRWLSAISRYGATISGGPNFAYERCVHRAKSMDLTGIDLSHWELAFCGAEMVRAATMRRFADSFAGAGFRASALYPCYGLAEATVFVTGSEPNGGFKTAMHESGVEAVSCGRAPRGERLAIVALDAALPLPDGTIGEIWVAGDHVASGYWGKPAATEDTFAARLQTDSETRFLRTGDLGWMQNGELYLASRLKDLVVWHGGNIHPEDIEATAVQSHPAFSGISAVFSIEVGDQERVVVVQELTRPIPQDFDPNVALAALRDAIAREHGIHLYDALVMRPGSVPRTTSGKIQRQRCRELYRHGHFEDAICARIRC